MVLEDFQRLMLQPLFDGVTETLILLPKKNGKTTLLAALALFHLLTTPDAECVIAAAARHQAEIMLKQARKFIQKSPSLSRLMKVQRREIHSLVDDGIIRILAADADTADGVIPTLALVDELHRHKSADLYGVFADGLGPRNGKMITISTAGDDDMSPLGKMRRAAYELPGLKRDGAYRCASTDDYAMHEWALEPDQDLEDLELVATANPASWQTIERLQLRRNSPSMTTARWARFGCGVWMRESDAAISMVEWAACSKDYPGIPEGEPVRVGIDVGWKWDTTAIVPHWLRPDGSAVIGQPVILTPPQDGTSLDKQHILAAVAAINETNHVIAVVMDPAAEGEVLAQDLEAAGFTVVGYSQAPQPMSLAAERTTTSIREGRLLHPDDPELNSHVLNSVPKWTTSEQWRFAKSKSRRPIDGLIAMAMVHSSALADQDTEEKEPLIAWA